MPNEIMYHYTQEEKYYVCFHKPEHQGHGQQSGLFFLTVGVGMLNGCVTYLHAG